jgi:hypothetical protein
MSAIAWRVIMCDGAMGAQLQAADLTLCDVEDLGGCDEIPDATRPIVGRDEIRSAAIWLTLVARMFPARFAVRARGDEPGVQTRIGRRRRLSWSRGVATVPGPAGIRHARQS